MDLQIEPQKQRYLFFDFGHDTTKVAHFSKNITNPFEYVTLPTELYSVMHDELKDLPLLKQNIDLHTLKFINTPDRSSIYLNPFIEDGILQDYKLCEDLIEMMVNKMVVKPISSEKLLRDENLDLENKQLTPVQTYDIPLNITFSEPSLNINLEDQIDQRKFLAEFCFEKIGCQSVSFAKQSSMHIFSEGRYNGLVVDLGAHFTQISPVTEGYSSSCSSSSFKINGKKVDNYLYKRIYRKFTTDNPKMQDPKLSQIGLLKLKYDLKETGLSPYQVPFNYEVLLEKQKLDPSNKQAYRQYLLPDNSTLMTINIGSTEKTFMNEMIELYNNSDLYSTKEEMNEQLYHPNLNDTGKKSLSSKVKETIDNFCKSECMSSDIVNYVLYTGGGLKLRSQEGKRLTKVMTTQTEQEVVPFYPNVEVACADEPYLGSILTGAHAMVCMPQFDQEMTVSKKEYDADDSVIIKKLF